MTDSPATVVKPPARPLLAVLNFFTSLKLAVAILGTSAVLVYRIGPLRK